MIRNAAETDLSFGELVFRVPWLADHIAQYSGPQYLEFVVPPVEEPDMTIRVVGPGAELDFTADEIMRERDGVLFWSGRFGAVRIDLSSKSCDLLAKNPYHASWIFRFVVGGTVLSHNGLLMHSAGLVHCGRGFLYLGPSGAGKSTLAKAAAARGGTNLCDESTIVRLDDKNNPVLYSTPFVRPIKWMGQNGRAPLVAISYLDRSRPRGQTPVPPAVAASLLASAIYYQPAVSSLASNFVKTAGSLLEILPMTYLSYPLEAIPWPPTGPLS